MVEKVPVTHRREGFRRSPLDRLLPVVEAKLAETNARIVELAALTSDLQRAAAALGAPARGPV